MEPFPNVDFPEPAPAAAEGSRARGLLSAIAVPVVAFSLVVAGHFVVPFVDGSDRAIVWVVGDAATLADAETRVVADTAFGGGATRDAADRPPTCPAGALRLHFSFRRIDEAQPARAALEQVAHATGATVCASHRFEINERSDVWSWLPALASIVLPLGFLAALRILGVDTVPSARGARRALSIAALCVAALLVAASSFAASSDPADATAMFALAFGVPLVHEASIRGWMLPRLRAVLGTPIAFAASVAASVASAAVVAGGPGALAMVPVAALCSALYLRTRSAPACIALHALAMAMFAFAAR